MSLRPAVPLCGCLGDVGWDRVLNTQVTPKIHFFILFYLLSPPYLYLPPPSLSPLPSSLLLFFLPSFPFLSFNKRLCQFYVSGLWFYFPALYSPLLFLSINCQPLAPLPEIAVRLNRNILKGLAVTTLDFKVLRLGGTDRDGMVLCLGCSPQQSLINTWPPRPYGFGNLIRVTLSPSQASDES